MSTTTRTAEERWMRFREARNTALAEEHGWLALTSFQWLGAEPSSVEQVPGLWSATHDGASLTASAADALTELAGGHRVDGTITAVLDDEESLLWVAHGGSTGRRIVVELARRAGRYAIRTRDAESPTVTAFGEVPVFGYRPDLVVEARFDPYDEPREERIRTAHAEVPGTTTLVGDVVFSLPGDAREFRLGASQEEAGALSITFHDSTNGSATAEWRKVATRRPRPDGTVIIDFNRTINYPSAFTPYGTCPMPVDTNRVEAAIEAGEKDPLS
ncbi:hypothetical protein MN0502_30640 [Arthrobacter sp. MN05-02]|nr:hypothetical protein MN0502_30640 [Arthrobacter sp. MN05-02]